MRLARLLMLLCQPHSPDRGRDTWRHPCVTHAAPAWYCVPQVIDYAGYYLDLLVQNYDVIQHMDGQPLQVCGVVKIGSCGLAWGGNACLRRCLRPTW
jgi:hypothetical protein